MTLAAFGRRTSRASVTDMARTSLMSLPSSL
jgi:hypothetical protein